MHDNSDPGVGPEELDEVSGDDTTPESSVVDGPSGSPLDIEPRLSGEEDGDDATSHADEPVTDAPYIPALKERHYRRISQLPTCGRADTADPARDPIAATHEAPQDDVREEGRSTEKEPSGDAPPVEGELTDMSLDGDPGLIPRPRPAPEAASSGITAFAAGEDVRDESRVDVRPSGILDPRLVSSAHGRIEELLLAMPSYVVEADGQGSNLPRIYQRLFEVFASTKLVILTQSSVRARIEQWLEQAGAKDTLLVVENQIEFSPWAQDPYVVVEDSNQSQLRAFVEPCELSRESDKVIASQIAKSRELTTKDSALHFAGGNILVGDDFVLVGADDSRRTMESVGSAAANPTKHVDDVFRQEIDGIRTVHHIGSSIPIPTETSRPFELDGEQWTEYVYRNNKSGTVQPLFHIDMFITLAGRGRDGRYRLVVADPRSAAGILGTPESPDSLSNVFDDIAAGLSRSFDVYRSPMPYLCVDDRDSRVRCWYFASYNNAVVQVVEGKNAKRTIWMPTYGHGDHAALEKTDQANQYVWEGLGFEVVELGDYHELAEALGAVHCISKDLKRSCG